MHWTKSACLIELSASMKPLDAYKVTKREGMEGSGRYGQSSFLRAGSCHFHSGLNALRRSVRGSGPRGWQVASPGFVSAPRKGGIDPS